VSYLDKKGKRTTAKRDDKRVETKINRKRIISERHQVARQEKTVKKPRQQKLKKDQKRWKTDEEYAAQDKQKRNGRYNYSRQQEIGSRNELKRMDRRERYSMNHSGFTTPSSLSHRRGRL